MRYLAHAALLAIAACGPARHPATTQARGQMSWQTAGAIVAKRCSSCHDGSHTDRPVFVDRELTPALAADGVKLVCAGDMPQDHALSSDDRNQVVAALCTLAGTGRCTPCSQPVYVRSPKALARIVQDATAVDVSRTHVGAEMTIHSRPYALATRLDATYFLLYLLLVWEGCKTSADVSACVTSLVREDRWQVPPPVR